MIIPDFDFITSLLNTMANPIENQASFLFVRITFLKFDRQCLLNSSLLVSLAFLLPLVQQLQDHITHLPGRIGLGEVLP